MTLACGCPTGPGLAITDQAVHDAFHELVVEQGGPAGVVNAKTLNEARGLVSFVGTADLLSDDRNVLSGKRRSSPQRRAEAKLREDHRRARR